MLRRLFEHTPGPRQAVAVDDGGPTVLLRVRTDPVTIVLPLGEEEAVQLVAALTGWLRGNTVYTPATVQV
jgi:hypothetical protein